MSKKNTRGISFALAALAALPAIAAQPVAPETGPAREPLELQLNEELPPGVLKPKPKPEEQKPAEGEKVRTIYLSEPERQRIRDEVRQEVLETARKENWAVPGTIPEWIRRFHLGGDLQMRAERDLYTESNSNQFFDFRVINNGAPVNVTPPQQGSGQPLAIPLLNTTKDRFAAKLRVRFGFTADVTDGIKTTLRLATGSANNPASTNQTLGSDFNRVNFLLDRAYVRFQMSQSFASSLGRMPNPFATASELVWDRDLSFDGIDLRFTPKLGDAIDLRFDTGAFSVENTDPNYPGNSAFKVGSYDKWMFGAQIEATMRVNERISLQPSVALYAFTKVQGQLSDCGGSAPLNNQIACDTDASRPLFVQKGNTMFAIRPLAQNPGDPDFQYFGLASNFRIAHAAFSADTLISGPVHLALDLDYARNLAFKASDIDAHAPVNNLGPCRQTSTSSCEQHFDGGGNAWQAQLRIGYPLIETAGQWQALVGYRHVESDAVIDGFTDSDFHLGGTNAKGFFVGGTMGIARGTYVTLRYLSADELTSEPLSIDVVQLDLGVRF